MYAIVSFLEEADNLVIKIKQQKSIIYKVALWTIVTMLLPVSIFGLFIVMQHEKKPIMILGMGGLFFILIIFVFKHLKNVYGTETLTVNRKAITYQKTFLGLGKYIEIKSNEITRLKYVGYDDNIKHDLEIKGDVLGFGAGQGEINYLNQEGTAVIISTYIKLRFGLNISFEDVLEMKKEISKYIKL